MIIQVLQLIDPQGRKTEYWRLTARTDEKSNACGLCNHLHNSYLEAWNCKDAWKAAIKIRGDSG
ncbi:MAG: hypothetical protein V7K48_34675 [Nostoc sp.]|uniref:hypothetical protein n=1 Tax=Nostoc sp. TaxID=1180 RepID=UPI002FFCDA4F